MTTKVGSMYMHVDLGTPKIGSGEIGTWEAQNRTVHANPPVGLASPGTALNGTYPQPLPLSAGTGVTKLNSVAIYVNGQKKS